MLIPFPENLIDKVEVKNGEIILKDNASKAEQEEFLKIMNEHNKESYEKYGPNGELLEFEI